jgi:hypothetical protein
MEKIRKNLGGLNAHWEDKILIVRWQRYTHVLKYEIQMCKLDLSSPPLPQSISMDIHVKLRIPINAASQPASSLLHSSSSSLSGSQTPSHPPTGLCYANRCHHYSLHIKAYTPILSYSHAFLLSLTLAIALSNQCLLRNNIASLPALGATYDPWLSPTSNYLFFSGTYLSIHQLTSNNPSILYR